MKVTFIDEVVTSGGCPWYTGITMEEAMKLYMIEVGISFEGVAEQRVCVDRETARSAAKSMRSRFPDSYEYYVIVRGPFGLGEDAVDAQVPVENF